jgi:hypothetical protein
MTLLIVHPGRKRTPAKDSRTLASLKARPVSDDPAPPAGLIVNYLVFGERAVDYGAMND